MVVLLQSITVRLVRLRRQSRREGRAQDLGLRTQGKLGSVILNWRYCVISTEVERSLAYASFLNKKMKNPGLANRKRAPGFGYEAGTSCVATD